MGNAELLSTADPLWNNFLFQLNDLGVYDGPPLPKFSGGNSSSGEIDREDEIDDVEQLSSTRFEL